MANAQKLGLGLIMACLDGLLVLERLFWYTGGQIDEKCVHAACLYYLRIRPKVFARLMGRLGTNFLDAENWPNRQELERLISDIVKEFRYKRRFQVRSSSNPPENRESGDANGAPKDEPPHASSDQ